MSAQSLQGNETTPKYKSVKLEPKEITALKQFISKHPNRSVAATALGLKSRTTLGNILRAGSGSQDNITLIREKIGTAA